MNSRWQVGACMTRLSGRKLELSPERRLFAIPKNVRKKRIWNRPSSSLKIFACATRMQGSSLFSLGCSVTSWPRNWPRRCAAVEREKRRWIDRRTTRKKKRGRGFTATVMKEKENKERESTRERKKEKESEPWTPMRDEGRNTKNIRAKITSTRCNGFNGSSTCKIFWCWLSFFANSCSTAPRAGSRIVLLRFRKDKRLWSFFFSQVL